MAVISEEELHLILGSSPCTSATDGSPCAHVDMGPSSSYVVICDDTLAYAMSIGYTAYEFAIAVLRFSQH